MDNAIETIRRGTRACMCMLLSKGRAEAAAFHRGAPATATDLGRFAARGEGRIVAVPRREEAAILALGCPLWTELRLATQAPQPSRVSRLCVCAAPRPTHKARERDAVDSGATSGVLRLLTPPPMWTRQGPVD